MIDQGFTEKQILTEFSNLALKRYFIYKDAIIQAKNDIGRRSTRSNLLSKTSKGSVGTQHKSAW